MIPRCQSIRVSLILATVFLGAWSLAPRWVLAAGPEGGDQASMYFESARRKLDDKNFEGAIADFTRAIALRRDFYLAYYYIGCSRLLAGDRSSAMEFFQKSMDTGVEHFVEYRSVAKELERLKKE